MSYFNLALHLLVLCLLLGLYSTVPPPLPVTIEQIRSGNIACINNLGPKEFLEQHTPDGFKVRCNDGTIIAGKNHTHYTEGHRS